jgi:hypothetical protein
MTVRTRLAPGSFGPAIAIGRRERLVGIPLMTFTRLLDTAISGLRDEFGLGGAPPDSRGSDPRALLGADQRRVAGAGDEPVTGNEVAGTSKRTSFVTRLPDTRRQVETVTVIRADQQIVDTGRTSARVQG